MESYLIAFLLFFSFLFLFFFLISYVLKAHTPMASYKDLSKTKELTFSFQCDSCLWWFQIVTDRNLAV